VQSKRRETSSGRRKADGGCYMAHGLSQWLKDVVL
jgi:hypothetical protein